MLLDPVPVIESRQLHATVTLDNPMAAEAELLSVSLALQYRDSSGDLSIYLAISYLALSFSRSCARACSLSPPVSFSVTHSLSLFLSLSLCQRERARELMYVHTLCVCACACACAFVRECMGAYVRLGKGGVRYVPHNVSNVMFACIRECVCICTPMHRYTYET